MLTSCIRISPFRVAHVLKYTKSHDTGHVFLFDKNNNLVLGSSNNNISSFGGYKDANEVLIDTIVREYREETLDCVYDYKLLQKQILSKSIVIIRKSFKGSHYTVFCKIDNHEFNSKQINKCFKLKLCPELPDEYKEHDRISVVNLNTIIDAIRQNTYIVTDTDNKFYTIRSTNILEYQWLISSIDNQTNELFN